MYVSHEVWKPCLLLHIHLCKKAVLLSFPRCISLGLLSPCWRSLQGWWEEHESLVWGEKEINQEGLWLVSCVFVANATFFLWRWKISPSRFSWVSDSEAEVPLDVTEHMIYSELRRGNDKHWVMGGAVQHVVRAPRKERASGARKKWQYQNKTKLRAPTHRARLHNVAVRAHTHL